MHNERGAGRKRILSDSDLSIIRDRISQGDKIGDIAVDYHITRQTLSKWIHQDNDDIYRIETDRPSTERMVCRSLSYWNKINKDFSLSNDTYRLRMDYMHKDKLCTAILVSLISKKIIIKNYTDILFQRAFGATISPDWSDFYYFLESRCFPKNRYNYKEVLASLGLDSYDPLDIVLATGGRIEGDFQWIRFTHLET